MHNAYPMQVVPTIDLPNGSSTHPAAQPNPFLRERWVDLGETYPGHQVFIRFNPNKKGLQQLPADATEDDKFLAGLKLMVLDHRIHWGDGTPDSPWIDPDTNQPIPAPSTDEFWEVMPNEVLAIIAGHIAVDQKKVQNGAARIFGGSIESSSAGIPPSEPGPSGSAGSGS